MIKFDYDILGGGRVDFGLIMLSNFYHVIFERSLSTPQPVPSS